ncbi:MAG: sigma-70 family RNA polymerase sigma factor [Lachnospiraceae bacterium]|nr:sigma-70 family RNA polymerase sigma factor [Lachnospiraceae bacterium]
MTIRDRSDEELLALCRGGQEQAYEVLAERYKTIVRREARKYYLAGGADEADLIQEGMIGLYQAVLGYNPDRGASFRSFAVLVIRRRILNAVSAANRRRHEPLNDYIPLGESADGSAVNPAADESDSNPERIALEREEAAEKRRLRQQFVRQLSPFERQVFETMQDGMTLGEAAAALDRSKKSVDNARTRIRRKWEAFTPTP